MVPPHAKPILWTAVYAGAAIGLLAAIPIVLIFNADPILWSVLSPAIGVSLTINAAITYAVLKEPPRDGRCAQCLYDLSGLAEETELGPAKCPECGHPIAAPNPDRYHLPDEETQRT